MVESVGVQEQLWCSMERYSGCTNKDLNEMISINGYHDVPANDEASLIKDLAHQPVTVAVDASGRDFQFHSRVVFDGHCGTDLDHGVAAVGYGTSKGLDYVIVKNSWGSRWGEKGLIRLKRSTSKPYGLCVINKMASYLTKKTN
ncbi:cysteine protease XCP2-like [Silene latifolia]|uniref:cysteine protease XCP2-like n=1 Tax=Silene latifolia TaxID=37657 RepID=UPI003D784ABB